MSNQKSNKIKHYEILINAAFSIFNDGDFLAFKYNTNYKVHV